MYVIFVMIRLLDVEFWIMSGDFNQFPIEVLKEFCGYDRVSVFGRKHYVVVTKIDAMIIMSVV